MSNFIVVIFTTGRKRACGGGTVRADRVVGEGRDVTFILQLIHVHRPIIVQLGVSDMIISHAVSDQQDNLACLPAQLVKGGRSVPPSQINVTAYLPVGYLVGNAMGKLTVPVDAEAHRSGCAGFTRDSETADHTSAEGRLKCYAYRGVGSVEVNCECPIRCRQHGVGGETRLPADHPERGSFRRKG